MKRKSVCFRCNSLLLFFLLLSSIHSVNAQQRSQYDLAAWIIAAVADNDTTTINWALQQGGDIDYKRSGSTALAQAIYYKKPAMVTFLLQKGAKLESVNEEGLTALQYAEKVGDPMTIERLKVKAPLQKGADTKTIENNNDSTYNSSLRDSLALYPESNKYYVGQKVLHSRDKGKTWEQGTVKAISTDKDLLAAGLSPYLVENETQTVQNYLDTNFITTLARQPYWTNFYIGDWDLHLPITAVDRQIDRDIYTIISGGHKLPPLRIDADSSYSWVINKKKVLKGIWKRNNDAPGIILMRGDRSDNWLMYNTTDATNRRIYKSDYIILSPLSGKYSPKHGFRIVKKK